MNVWAALLAAAAVVFAFKALGYAVPAHRVESAVVARTAALVTVSLLAALVVVQTVADGDRFSPDARVAGLAAAVVALLLRAPFLVVVVAAAATTAVLRAVIRLA